MPNTLTQSANVGDMTPSVSVKEPDITTPAFHQKTRYRSQFGGRWTDLSNATDIVHAKRNQGQISQTEADLLHNWISNGFVIIENAVPREVIDSLIEDTERAWTGEYPSILVEHFVN